MMEEKPASMEGEIKVPPAEQPEVKSPTPSFLEKLKANKFKIFAGVLGVFVFAGAVFGAYKLGQRQSQPTPMPTPTPEVVATPTPDLTANWKTYTGEVPTAPGAGAFFSIKYPSEWELEIGPGPNRALRFTAEDGGEYRMALGAGARGVSPIKTEEIKMGGQPAKRMTEEFEGKTIIIATTTKEGVDYIFEFVVPSLNQEKYLDIFNLMLSTFRFLEETEGWNKYDDKEGNYSIKYPSDWLFRKVSLLGDDYVSSIKINALTTNDIPNVKIIVLKSDSPLAKSITRGGEKLIIDNETAFRSKAEVSVGVFHDTVVVTKGNYTYSIELEYGLGQEEQYTRIIDSMLSTFRFLE